MSSRFEANAVVWVYMEGYPWWPGIVMDPTVAASTLNGAIPEGKQVVMCLPSTAPSVVVVDPSNQAEVRRFRGAEEDAEFVDAARASSDCAPAVEEALQFFAGAASVDTAAAPTVSAPGAAADGDADADLELQLEMDGEANAAAGETEERRRHRHKKEKKERKHREEKAREKMKRRDSDDESAASVSHSDDADDAYFLDTSNASKAHKSSKKKKHRAERSGHDKADGTEKSQRTLDSYDMMGTPKYASADDIDYYYRKLRQGRERPSNAQLLECAERINHVVALVDGSLIGDEEREEALLKVLRPLKSYDVTMEQLKTTNIGVVVGTLLKKRFPYAVQQLAQAIQLYWFRSLPTKVQEKFTQLNEIDRCSTDTTVGARSEDMNSALGALGVHIYETFTEEEIYDAPPGVDIIAVANALEEALLKRERDERVMVLSMLGDASNSPIRRALLDGKITADTLIQNAGDVRSVMRQIGTRATVAGKLRVGALRINTNLAPGAGPAGALTSPTSGFFSPQGDDGNSFGSPMGRGSAAGGVTTLHACPNCGAHEAQRTVYTVSAHDNFPDILRCLKCNTTWNISDQ